MQGSKQETGRENMTKDGIENRIPFLLKPVGKDYLWGGSRLNDDFSKGIPMSPLAETWECSTHPDGECLISGGPFDKMTLRRVLREHPELCGEHGCVDGELPVMVKLIDANRDLSVQVHPTDEYAREHENGQRGKTEMWYVLDTTGDAALVYGMKTDATREQIKKAVDGGELEKYLLRVPIKKNDVFFIEAGMIHAIGAGALVAEVQENSNLTYRLYDYKREDKDGKLRPLHIDKALDVAKLKKQEAPRQPMRVLKYAPGMARELLCRCRYFEVYRMLINTERCRQMAGYEGDELSYRILLCVDGCGSIRMPEGEAICFFKGDCVFIPAGCRAFRLHGRAVFLDIRGGQ